jgi:hypothetical protein
VNDKQRRRAQRVAKRAQRRQRLGDRVARPVPQIPPHLVTDWDICNPGVPRLAEETVFDVELYRSLPDDPNDPEDVPGWSAEGGMRGDGSSVTFDWTKMLAETVEQVMEEVEKWRTRFPDLPIGWVLANADEVGPLASLTAAERVELPGPHAAS